MNMYATKKAVGSGMLDVALLATNAAEMRRIIVAGLYINCVIMYVV